MGVFGGLLFGFVCLWWGCVGWVVLVVGCVGWGGFVVWWVAFKFVCVGGGC